MSLNIDTYLDHVKNEAYGEDVSDAIINVGNVLNTDQIVDIEVEKTIIKYHPIGNVIRIGIARMLAAFANYEPNKKVLIKSKTEYMNLGVKDPNTLYLIRKQSRCIIVTLKPDNSVDMTAPARSLNDIFYWNAIRAFGLEDLSLRKEVFVGSGFDVDEVLEEQFESTNIAKITIDLPSYIINRKAFFECYNLEEVHLGSGVTGIASDAFQECTNLKRIYIDLPQGSIIGAPWDAYNATVIWTG